MGIESLKVPLLVLVLFALGLGIGNAWQQHSVADRPLDLATILAPACAPSTAGASRAERQEQDSLPSL